ncbi:hypothetical protein BRAS3843_2210005 [Bradyrhizobium sp. STM 3843]|nr:hypothetical protein BRAS3843_2210005 [Bradyrhizobium sp. STM 3843]
MFGFLTCEPNADQDHDVGFAGAKRAAPDPSGTSATDPLGSCLGSKVGFRVAVDTRYFQNPKD